MIQKFRFDRKFTQMNELINMNRYSRFAGHTIKKEETDYAYYLCKEQRLKPFTKPVRMKCLWKYKRTNQDPDNIRSQLKPILDGMVKAGILPDDSIKTIKGFDGDEYMQSPEEGGEIHIYDDF